MTEIEQRRAAVASRLGELKVDALLVTSAANVRYLSDYVGSNGLMLITPTDAHFFTDPRYGLEAQAKISCKVHVCKKPLIVEAAALIKRKRLKKVGFAGAWLKFDDYARLKAELPAGVALVPAAPVIEELRMVKSADEIAKIRKSVQANSEAYSKTMRRIKLGVREQDIAAELEFQMRMLGAEKPAFETIVAVGDRSALPHAHPTARKLGENELLLIDMGASLDGYCSDMTRVAYAGAPPKKVRDLYRAVLEAQLTSINAVRAGIPSSKVDSAARQVLKKHGLEKDFVHSTGHGLGLEIHESPRVAAKDKTMLQAGMVITIEPGAYLQGFGGVRIEDTVLVTENGCEVLTPTPKEFVNI